MASPKSQILIYDELGPAEQALVDTYLQRHPEDRHLLNEGRRLRSLLAASPIPELSDDLLAEVVASRGLGFGGQSEAMGALAKRVDEACSRDPALAKRYAELEQRLVSITAELPSAEQKFAEVLKKVDSSRAREPRRGKYTRRERAPERAPIGRMRLPRRTAYLVAVALVCMVALTVLISDASQPAYQQVAALDGVPERYASPQLRGGDTSERPTEVGFASALNAIATSRTTTLGLFPRYDEDLLRTAQEHLIAVVASGTLDPQSVANAQVINALIYLHLGEVATARRILQAVASDEGPASLDARQILSDMDKHGLLTDAAS